LRRTLPVSVANVVMDRQIGVEKVLCVSHSC
jgi:hypothetical protein